MYLKSIEVQGFKSFANRIVFEFHNGITGIVGPNGSGKSNVADAVRWVLGEQRVKQLRGGSMQDVIFSGTQLRKPQGFAYVAITLDNSDHQLAIDYDQVTVSRRLYRSGESEYRINGSTCRLKDVNELFYDTGIGKEGYSIIGQGQIDKILSGRPEERRELFDEAAGIVKFKRRKAIAQKKLDEEKQNLIRVTDVLSELEKQVGPLERQAETAKQYLKLKEELKIYDANAFLLESEGMKNQLHVLAEKEAIVQGDLEEAKGQEEAIKKEYAQLEDELSEIEDLLGQIRTQENQAAVKKNSLEGQINVLNEQINTEKMNAEHLKSRMSVLKREIEERTQQLIRYREEKKGFLSRAEEVLNRQKEAEISLMDADIFIQDLDKRLEQAKEKVMNALNQKAEVSAKQQRYEAVQEQIQVRKSEVSQKLLKKKSDESVQEEQLKEEEKKKEKLDKQIDQFLLKEKEMEEENRRLEEELIQISKNVLKKQQEYQANDTRLDSLKNLAERYEGYGNSIRKIMEIKNRVPGIHGVVADLLATQKQYETAIETALGGSIQHIVTDSEQTAKQLIEYLKKNRFGRATFLPLTSMEKRNPFSQEKALAEPGVLGLASQLVFADFCYSGLIHYLLGRVIVVDQIDHGIALEKKFQYSLRIVTLEGELLSPGGSMTGGAFKNSSSLLGRKREMEELESACRRIKKEEDHLVQSQKQTAEKEKQIKTKLEQIKEEKQNMYLLQHTAALGIRQLEEKKTEMKESSLNLMKEHSQLEKQIQEVKDNQAVLFKEMEELERQSSQADQEIAQMHLQLEEAKKTRENEGKALSSVQLEAASCQQNLTFIQENIRRIEEEIRKREEEGEEIDFGQHGSERAVSEKKQEIEQLRAKISESVRQADALSVKIEEKTSIKEKANRQQKALFARREEFSEKIRMLDKELFRLQSQKEKLDEKLENQVNYMWNEYELTCSTAETLKDSCLSSLSEIRKQIDRRKNAIKHLGNVNVNAIEDYKEVSKRYEFLTAQHQDLVEAESALLGIIKELDIGMRRQFEEQFAKIRQEFDHVFKELFGGGRGTLELTEQEDILEAGIQIISQPPGKKLQNMMQLSGGEKALTAIALLFAIQNLKPSPFCLLDEIEAALDDSNVDRFAGYLHKLTENTQFIVITHRRGTMVASDRLYGITMQEKGVSTLVSVNLIESDLDK